MSSMYFDTVAGPDGVADPRQPVATARCPVSFWADTDPDSRAIVLTGESSTTLSYRVLDARISDMQRRLHELDEDSRSLLGVVAQSPVQTIVVLFACLREQIPLVIFGRKEPPAVVDGVIGTYKIATMVVAEHGGSTNDNEQGMPGLTRTRYTPQSLMTEPSNRTGSAEISLDEPATLLFTSGTTAEPRLVVHSFRNHLASAHAACSFSPLSRSDNWLLSLGLNHVGGLGIVFRSFSTGSSITVTTRRLSPELFYLSGVTHASLVPAQLNMLVSGNVRPNQSMQLLVGGAAAAEDSIRKAVRAGFLIRTTYGLTEMASQVATSKPWTTDSAVVPPLMLLEHVEARVRHHRLQLRGAALFAGYLENGHVNAHRTSDGYFATHDLAEITNHELKISGRADTIFNSGGEKIQPSEIENALLALDGVTQACVVPVPDVVFGFLPAAFIETSTPTLLRDNIEASLRKVLPGFKIPAFYYDWPADNDNSGLKISRQKLTQLASELQHNVKKGRKEGHQ